MPEDGKQGLRQVEEQEHEAKLKSEVVKVVQEIYQDEAYLQYMKDRWGIDFEEGTFTKKAEVSDLDSLHFFSDYKDW